MNRKSLVSIACAVGIAGVSAIGISKAPPLKKDACANIDVPYDDPKSVQIVQEHCRTYVDGSIKLDPQNLLDSPRPYDCSQIMKSNVDEVRDLVAGYKIILSCPE